MANAGAIVVRGKLGYGEGDFVAHNVRYEAGHAESLLVLFLVGWREREFFVFRAGHEP